MTIRPATILWLVLWVVAAFGLYMVKYKVQALKVEVAATETQLREAKKNLHVLTAEWTYLNRPERLRQLAARYLSEKPTQGRQLTDLVNLPVKAPVTPVTNVAGAPQTPDGITLVSGGDAHDE